MSFLKSWHFGGLLSADLRDYVTTGLVPCLPRPILRFSEGVFDYPVPNAVRSLQVIFVHVPKCGGSTVALQLYGRFIGHRSALWYRSVDSALFDLSLKFALYRDPVKRLISSFGFVKSGGGGLVRVRRSAIDALNGVNSLADLMDWDQSGSVLRSIDPVFHSQCSYVCDADGGLMVDHLFDLDVVSGRKVYVGDHLVDFGRRENVGRLSAGIDTRLSAELVSWVRSIYPEDFELGIRMGFLS